MCKDNEAMVGSRSWWGGGDGKIGQNPVTGRPHQVELVQTRELLQLPPVSRGCSPGRYRVIHKS